MHHNSIFGFLGPNGAGKTTTIKLLLGLIKPTAGSASVFGMDSVHQSVDICARGERQRLGIAQAQVNYPDLLILDEPAASLDPIGRRDVLEIMSKLRKYSTIFYSTHILDDVQRVSDTVAILNKGKLVAQGPIEELLAGSEGTVYVMHMKGDADSACSQIQALPWVKDIKIGAHMDETTWQVSVTDPAAAEAQLLKMLVNGPVLVTEFHRRQYELEDIFMQVIEGGQNVRK